MRILKRGMYGSDIEEIQSILNILGYNAGSVDGIFGRQTENAVKSFQNNRNLVDDGIIGPKTYFILESLLKGYDKYTVKSGDTLYKIASKYNTPISRILTANPNINPFLLNIGEEIIVPYNTEVVQTDISYTYSVLAHDIAGLKARYPFLKISSIGRSVENRDLFLLQFGEGSRKVFYN